jgi:hypothetical protein
VSGERCGSTRGEYRCELLAGHEAEHKRGGLGWIVSDATIAEADEMARADRERDPLVVKAWTESRGDLLAALRSRARQHERLAAMGDQETVKTRRRLAEMGVPTYAQQAIAERALAEQVEALTMPGNLSGLIAEVKP